MIKNLNVSPSNNVKFDNVVVDAIKLIYLSITILVLFRK